MKRSERCIIALPETRLADVSCRTRRTRGFDPATEKFVGVAEATAMLTRRYRPPYVVPERV